jgi:hypothetical protein
VCGCCGAGTLPAPLPIMTYLLILSYLAQARNSIPAKSMQAHNKDAQRCPAFRFRVPTNPRLWVHALQTAHQRA